MLAQEFRCSDENILRITGGHHVGEEKEGDCEPGKFLIPSGEIFERKCVTSHCTKFGGKCPTQFDFPAGQFSIDVACHPPSPPYQFQTGGQSNSHFDFN